MLKWHSKEDIITELRTSISNTHVHRFEILEQNGEILTRAVYARKFEKAPLSTDTDDALPVDSLYDSCLQKIMNNLDDYDLTHFQDEYTISRIIYRLKSQKKLNVKGLKVLLVPVLEHLDLEGLYLTENILKLVWKNCPYMKELSLRNCGYIMTDSILLKLLKNLPMINTLNLAFCDHLTNKSFDVIAKYSPQKKVLILNKIKNFTDDAVLNFIPKCPNLQRLEIYNLRTTTEGKESLLQLVRSRNMKFTCGGLEYADVIPEKPAYL